MSFKGPSDMHACLLQDLADALTAENFRNMKQLCTADGYGGLGAGQLEKITTFSELFQKVEQKGIFKEGDYKKLKELLDKCGNKKAVETVVKCETKLNQAGYGDVEYPCTGSDAAAQKGEHLVSRYTPQIQSPAEPLYKNQKLNPNPDGRGHVNETKMDDDEYYKIGNGYILFINNHFFQSANIRKGAEKDTFNVKSTCYHYLPKHELDINEDVEKEKFWKIMNNTHEKLMKGNYSSFMLIISSHGKYDKMLKSDCIVLVDGTTVTLDEVKRKFNGTNAPFLIKKPKVFIIQACRGGDVGKAVYEPGLPEHDFLNPDDSRQLSMPENADVLEAYATSEGEKAWRNLEKGSWYIFHLLEAIRENNQHDHFLDLLLRVHRKIAPLETDRENPGKQMPCFVTTFTKKFCLN